MSLSVAEFQTALEEENAEKIAEFIKHSPNKFESLNYKNSHGEGALHIIARKGTPEDFDELMKTKGGFSKVHLNEVNHKGQTALHIASQCRGFQMVKCILNHGAKLMIKDKEGNTPLHLAVKFNVDRRVIGKLCTVGEERNKKNKDSILPSIFLEQPFDINAKNNAHQSAYRIARLNNNRMVMTQLRVRGGQDHFETAKEAIYEDNIQKLQRLLNDYPTIVEDVDEQGNSLLHHAILAHGKNVKQMVTCLCEKDGDINAINHETKSVLHLIGEIGLWHELGEQEAGLLRHVVELGADLKQSDAKGIRLLHHAASQNNIWAIDQLLSFDPFCDYVTVDGLTPLHMAALANQKEALLHLVSKGANINQAAYPSASVMAKKKPPSDQPITPAWLALHNNQIAVLCAIIDYKLAHSDIKDLIALKTGDGITLVHLFSCTGQLAYLRKCIEFGCDMDARTTEGKTSLSMAEEFEQHEVAAFLRSQGAKASTDSKSIMTRASELVQSQREFAKELEQTTGYTFTNLGFTFGPTLMSLPSGPIGMSLTFAWQLCLYNSPVLLQANSKLYYHLKPLIHNHTHQYVEKATDAVFSVPSYLLSGMQWWDILKNPVRYGAGVAGKYVFANVGAKLTDNKDVQGALYALGRQAGFMAVDSLAHYRMVRDNSDAYQRHLDEELIKAQTLWGSLVGKDKGEGWLHSFQSIVLMRDKLYFTLGAFEQGVLDTSSEAQKRFVQTISEQKTFQPLFQSIDSALSIVGGYSASLSAEVFYSRWQRARREIHYHSEKLALDLEILINKKLLRDSDFRNYSMEYLFQARSLLLAQNVQYAQDDKELANEALKKAQEKLDEIEQSDVIDETERQEAKESLSVAKDAFEQANHSEQDAKSRLVACEQQLRSIWEKTPKGRAQIQLGEVLIKEFEARSAYEELLLQSQFISKHEMAGGDKAQVFEQLQQAEIRYQAASDEVRSCDKALIDTLTPLERARHTQLQQQSKAVIDKEFAAFNEHGTTVLDKQHQLHQLHEKMRAFKAGIVNIEKEYIDAEKELVQRQKVVDSLLSPGRFIARDVVNEARGYSTPSDIAGHIIARMIETGAVDFEKAEGMRATFETAANNKESLISRVSEQWNQLNGSYLISKIALKDEQLKKLNDLETCLKKQNEETQAIERQLSSAKDELMSLLPLSEHTTVSQGVAEHRYHIEDELWYAANGPEHVYKTLCLVGQVPLGLNFAEADNFRFSPSLRQNFIRQALARNLVDYKYLFLPRPSIERVSEEVKTLVSEFPEKLSIQSVETARANVMKSVAETMVSLSMQRGTALQGSAQSADIAKSVASDVVLKLERVLGIASEDPPEFKFENVNLSEYLSQALNNRNKAAASEAISKTLLLHTKQFSVKEKGEWKMVKMPDPIQPPPRREHPRRGLSLMWHNFGHYVKALGEHPIDTLNDTIAPLFEHAPKGLNFGVNVNNQGVQANFGSSTFDITRFNPPKVNVFSSYRSEMPVSGEARRAHEREKVQEEVSEVGLSSVIPPQVLRPLPPVPALVDARQFRVVPSQPVKVDTSLPVLPTQTFLPSFSTQASRAPLHPVNTTLLAQSAPRSSLSGSSQLLGLLRVPMQEAPLASTASAPRSKRTARRADSMAPTRRNSQRLEAIVQKELETSFSKIDSKTLNLQQRPLPAIFHPKQSKSEIGLPIAEYKPLSGVVFASYGSEFLSHSDFGSILSHKNVSLNNNLLARSIQFGRMVIKAIDNPDDRDVRIWQENNCKEYPLGSAVYQGMSEYKLSDIQFVFRGMNSALNDIGLFSGAEFYRLTHGEETITRQTISQFVDFLTDRARIQQAARATSSYIRDDLGRLVRKEQTETGLILSDWVKQTGEMSPHDLLIKGGKELMYVMLGEGTLRAAGYSKDAAMPILKKSIDKDFFAQFGKSVQLGSELKSKLDLLTLFNQRKITKQPSFKSVTIGASNVEIYYGYAELSKRQSDLLTKLPGDGAVTYVRKSHFNVNDLSALTAKTGDEFAMFTLGSQRMIIRGNPRNTIPSKETLSKILNERWKWSAHTHPGTKDIVLQASGKEGDRGMLKLIGQNRSLILNSAGRRNVFYSGDNHYISTKRNALRREASDIQPTHKSKLRK